MGPVSEQEKSDSHVPLQGGSTWPLSPPSQWGEPMGEGGAHMRVEWCEEKSKLPEMGVGSPPVSCYQRPLCLSEQRTDKT